MMDLIMTFVMPILMSEVLVPALSFVIAGFVAWAAKCWRDFTGVEIEARHRDAFQTSLENAARMLVMRHGPIVPGQAISNAILEEGLKYVKTGAPDAVRHFKVADDNILTRLLPHLLTAGIDLLVKR